MRESTVLLSFDVFIVSHPLSGDSTLEQHIGTSFSIVVFHTTLKVVMCKGLQLGCRLLVLVHISDILLQALEGKQY